MCTYNNSRSACSASSSMSAIQHIPPELLSQIFLTGQRIIHSHYSESHPDDLEEGYAPFEIAVSHVDSYWRLVSLATPQLWGRVVMRSNKLLDRPLRYLERCGATPIIAQIDIGSLGQRGDNGLSQKILDILFAKASTWKRISLRFAHIGDESESWFFEKMNTIHASSLEYFSMTLKNRFQTLSDEDQLVRDKGYPALLAGGAPKLDLLRISGRALSFKHLPMASITTLHLENMLQDRALLLSELRVLLDNCPRVVNLSMEGILLRQSEDWNEPSISAIDPVHMPCLQSLRVAGVTGGIYSGILRFITAPLLESLSLKKAQPNDLDAFLDTIRGSRAPKFPLKSLTLEDCLLTGTFYKRWCSSFPDIKHITVIDSPVNSPTLPLLLANIVNADNSPFAEHYLFFPSLQTLTMLLPYDQPADEDVVSKLVVFRASIGLRLRKLKLGTNSDLSIEELDEIKAELILYVDEVEMSNNFERRWPSTLQYVDEDDRWEED